jgi:hypothetical protein
MPTTHYGLPYQPAGQGDRQLANQALDGIDENIHAIAVTLSTLVQNTSLGEHVEGEALVGALDGTNRVFTVSRAPITGTMRVFAYGCTLLEGEHLTLSGAGNKTLTFNPGLQPRPGYPGKASYRTTEE